MFLCRYTEKRPKIGCAAESAATFGGSRVEWREMCVLAGLQCCKVERRIYGPPVLSCRTVHCPGVLCGPYIRQYQVVCLWTCKLRAYREVRTEFLNAVWLDLASNRPCHGSVRWLVTVLSPRRPGFNPMPVYLRFLVDKMAREQVFLRLGRFSSGIIIPSVLHSHSYVTDRIYLQLTVSVNIALKRNPVTC